MKLRKAAWKIYYPECNTLADSPAKITLHSIRINAFMILFAENMNNANIIGRLRYKSTKFCIYHQNAPALAAIHTRAVTITDLNSYNLDFDPRYVTDKKDEEE